jgi:chitinase
MLCTPAATLTPKVLKKIKKLKPATGANFNIYLKKEFGYLFGCNQTIPIFAPRFGNNKALSSFTVSSPKEKKEKFC